MAIKNKISFVALVSVTNANPNGDPLNENRPRTDYDEIGEISDVCIKRKIRNRMMDLEQEVFVQSENYTKDEFTCLKNRAESISKKDEKKDSKAFAKSACEKWLDVRSFGQVFAFDDGDGKKGSGVSIGVRGPVSVHITRSVDPIDVASMQITKSVSNKDGEKKGSDTMGMKHFVRYGLYVVKGSISPELASKTGFSDEDAEVLKECLATLFENDASSARPDGSIVVNKLYWFENEEGHNCSVKKIHDSVKIKKKDDVDIPKSFNDYIIARETLTGVRCEEMNIDV